jgi:SPP1 gp7 family putative phage head morphogenesis protein
VATAPQIDAPEMIRRTGRTQQRQIILPAIVPTGVQERELLRIYMRVVREWGRLIWQQVEPVYARTLSELVTDTVDDVESEMAAVQAALTRLVLTLDASLEDWTVRVEEWHRGRFGQLFTATGVRLDMILGRGDVAPTLQAVLGENTALIRSLSDQMRNGISGAVFRGLTNRSPATEVAREIRKITGVARKRAELIAADQLQKLTGRLDRERQEQVGIRKFQWVHSRKKHPRPEHVARDGTIYAWNSAVARTDPPGRAIRCGCRARAVVELK